MYKVFFILIVSFLNSNFSLKAQAGEFNHVSFVWENATIDGIYFEKVLQLVPVQINEYVYYMQFDLGTYESVIYLNELPVELLSEINNQIPNRSKINYHDFIEVETSAITYCSNKAVVDTTFLVMHNYSSSSSEILYENNYKIIGTIGRDVIRGSLILNYPEKKICLDCEQTLNTKAIDIIKFELIDGYQIYLPVTIQDSIYYFLFDTGSSMFSVLFSDSILKSLNLEKDHLKKFNLPSWNTSFDVDLYENNIQLEIGKMCYTLGKYYSSSRKDIGKLIVKDGLTESGIIGNKIFLGSTLRIDFFNNTIEVFE